MKEDKKLAYVLVDDRNRYVGIHETRESASYHLRHRVAKVPQHKLVIRKVWLEEESE